MNERINDLMNEAMPTIDWTARHGVELNNGERMKWYADWFDRFAELIVLECAQVLETNGDNQRTIRMTESIGHDKTTDWMEGYEEAVKQYGGFLLKKNAKQIKKHFGVKE